MNRRGFTFIELVTTFAIIAILAAILFPVFAKAREKARQTACINNLLNVGVALRMYAADQWGYLPPTDNDLTPLVNPRYLPEAASLTCPTLRGDGPIDFPPQLPEQVLARRQGYDYVYRGHLADDDPPEQGIAGDRFRDLHNTGANVLFLDGHAKWLSDKQFEAFSGAPPRRTPASPLYDSSKPMAGMLELGKLQVKLSGRAYLNPKDEPQERSKEGGGSG